jgi:hypothetical protein
VNKDDGNKKIGRRIKRILIIAATIIVLLAGYTVAFQLMFGASRRSSSYCAVPEGDRAEYVQGIIDSLDDDNAVKYYLMAGLAVVHTPEDKAFWDRFHLVIEEGWQGDDPELEKHIADNEKAFEYLRIGTQKDRYQFPYLGVTGDLFYLADARHFARLSVVKGRFQTHKEQFGGAADTYANLLKFSADMSDNGSMVHALTGSAVEGLAYAGMESFIVRLDDEEACEVLLSELVGIEKDRASLSELIKNEHAYSRQFHKNLPNEVLTSTAAPDDYNFSWYFLDTIGRTYWYLGARFSLDDGLREIDEFYHYLAEVSETAYPEILREPVMENAPTSEMLEGMAEATGGFFYITARYKTDRRANIIRVALHLRMLENGEYPESLEELADIVPEEMLIDPFSEKPFVYKKTDGGYLLYSYGGDLDDDGGKALPLRHDLETDGDMVYGPPRA